MNTTNEFLVGVRFDRIAILRRPGEMTFDQAIMLAAWLATMAGDHDGTKVQAAMEAVRAT